MISRYAVTSIVLWFLGSLHCMTFAGSPAGAEAIDPLAPPPPAKLLPPPVIAPATRPAAPAAATPPKKPAYSPALPADPIAELAAVDKLLAAKGPIPLKVVDADTVQLLHRKAIAHSMLNDLPKARDTMRRVASSGFMGRAASLNSAKIDILGRADAIRAVITLDGYLRAQDPPDEEAVMLMGVALQTAVLDGRTLQAERVATYDRYKTLLETQQPGRKLWGTTWVSEAEFNAKMEARNEAINSVRAAERSVLSAKRDLENTRRYYSGQRRLFGGVQRPTDTVSPAVAEATDTVRIADRRLADARARVPVPPWTASLKLSAPDALPGQTPAAAPGAVAGGVAGEAAAPEVRVAFVVDATGSMTQHFADVRDEVVKAVAGMGGAKTFRVIVATEGAARPLQPRWIPGGDAAARDVANVLDGIFPAGAGDPSAAIAAAMQLRPTIIWVATDGQFQDPAQLLALLKTQNADKRTRINTLTRYASADPAAVRTLWSIANESGGVCYGIDGLPVADPTPHRAIPVGPSIFDQ